MKELVIALSVCFSIGVIIALASSRSSHDCNSPRCGYLDNVRYCIEDGKVLRMEK